MAHLIKLEDYISRYQYDLNRYPSQFTRMKKERWYYLKSEWEQAQSEATLSEQTMWHGEDLEPEAGFFSQALYRIKNWKRHKKDDMLNEYEKMDHQLANVSLERLRAQFLNELFYSQLRWASSSLMEESTLHPRYKQDTWLRFFSLQIPDNYFLMYKPVFFIKKAPIDLDILLISPTELICLTILEGDELSVFEASSDRFWIEFVEKTRKKRISPLLSLSRMTGVVKPLLKEAGIHFPVRSVVLCPNSIIDNKVQGVRAEFIDKRTFEAWKEKQKKHPSPLKHDQLKVTSLLLSHCQTNAHQREQEVSSEQE
ncbi:hypothetical protein [Halalkalibacter urbisdiaboli]|uniref:hypothetical protein n=1 Tax=Halalkalibacter urbisdiaboli TaxID=1960589 RepID=UPI000B447E23|nr:hypothetical protein [Halalkalibacter urbisdiaboli]